jgi:hypothetical protein
METLSSLWISFKACDVTALYIKDLWVFLEYNMVSPAKNRGSCSQELRPRAAPLLSPTLAPLSSFHDVSLPPILHREELGLLEVRRGAGESEILRDIA